MSDSDFSRRDDIFSNPVRAGKRTYFFDVKATRGDDYYITITESKRRMDDNGKFIYDKHKIFLYKEDFDKFQDGFTSCVEFIRNSKGADYGNEPHEAQNSTLDKPTPESTPKVDSTPTPDPQSSEASDSFSDVEFDDLGKNLDE